MVLKLNERIIYEPNLFFYIDLTAMFKMRPCLYNGRMLEGTFDFLFTLFLAMVLNMVEYGYLSIR